MKDYSHQDSKQIKTKMEKYVPTPFIVDYLLRKVLLGIVLGLLFTARQLSKVYGFEYSAEVSDRDEWVWDLREKVPLYRARVERMD